jgi:hypothetical protein
MLLTPPRRPFAVLPLLALAAALLAAPACEEEPAPVPPSQPASSASTPDTTAPTTLASNPTEPPEPASPSPTTRAQATNPAENHNRAAATPPDAPPADAIVLTSHTLSDPGMNNMPSHTVLAPKGWAVEGGAFWAGRNFFRILPSQDIKATAPDGRQVHLGPSLGALDFIPSAQSRQMGFDRPEEGSAQDGYLVLYMPEDLDAWATFLEEKGIAQNYPEATDIAVNEVVVVPELTQIIKKQYEPILRQLEQQNQQSAAMGLNMRSAGDAAVLAANATYTLGGKRYEQLFVFGTSYLLTDSDSGRQVFWSIEPNVVYRAPAGELDDAMPLLMAIANSLRPTPQWAKMKADHIAKMNQINAQGAAERSRIIAESNREISRIITEGYEQRQATMDRSHRQTINAIREVENYTTPGSSTTVQLPHHYNHVYTNSNGEYILTDDALYNPNLDPTLNQHDWQPMQRAEP